MSQENMISEVLATFELSSIESQTYVYLARHGVLTCREISDGLKRHTAQMYPIMKNLQAKGLVESTLESPSRFMAVSFDKIIDLSVQIKHQEAVTIERERSKLLNYWMQFGQPYTQFPLERFVVIEGTNRVYSKIAEMVIETKTQFSSVSSLQGILKAEDLGIFDLSGPPFKSEVQFRLLTELTDNNLNQAKDLLRTLDKPNLSIKKVNMGKLPPRLVIRDTAELLFFVNSSNAPVNENTCLWTNCKSLVQAFTSIFEDSWRNSIDVNITLPNSGTISHQEAAVTEDESTITLRHNEALSFSNHAITFLTSASGLSELNKRSEELRNKYSDGVTIRIMAPITKENLKQAIQLSSFCNVRHVSSNYVETILADDSVVFQLQHEGFDRKKPKLVRTSDLEYVEPIKKGLNDIWNRSRPPSPETLESINFIGPTIFPLHPDDERKRFHNSSVIQMSPPSMVNEKAISDKCIHAEKIICNDPNRDISRAYATVGAAIIHPPKCLNLPNMIIQPTKIEKQSSFGEEDYILVSLADEEIGDGKSERTYRNVAVAGDNPNSQGILRAIYPEANIQLLKPDEIQIRIHGSTIFAGWTVPIQLISQKYILPPSCLIIEGYGKVHPRAFTYISPSGFRHEVEENYFDAFVTFIHSKTQYTGPGTEGFFYRDFVSTNYPPQADMALT